MDNAQLEPGGAVESWLDEVFDGLVGTGAGGRRALVEIEDHLTAAVAEARARGMSATEAERQAVSRFGSPTKVARGIRAAHRRSRVRPVLTGGWALAGAGVLALGISTSLVAALTWVFGGRVVGVDCTDVMIDRYQHSTCGTVDDARALGSEGVALLALGVLLTVALGLARRHTSMRSRAWLPRRRTLATVASLFFLVGVLVLSNPFNTFGVPQFGLYAWPVQASCGLAATLVAMSVAMWLGRLRQRPGQFTVALPKRSAEPAAG